MSQPDASSQGNPTDQMRVSDAERQVVVEQLAQAQASGQLDMDEFSDRTSQAHAARTYGELQPLTADLSGTAPMQPPVSTAPPSTGAPALAGVAQHYRSKAELKSAARHGDPEAAKKIFNGAVSSWLFSERHLHGHLDCERPRRSSRFLAGMGHDRIGVRRLRRIP